MLPQLNVVRQWLQEWTSNELLLAEIQRGWRMRIDDSRGAEDSTSSRRMQRGFEVYLNCFATSSSRARRASQSARGRSRRRPHIQSSTEIHAEYLWRLERVRTDAREALRRAGRAHRLPPGPPGTRIAIPPQSGSTTATRSGIDIPAQSSDAVVAAITTATNTLPPRTPPTRTTIWHTDVAITLDGGGAPNGLNGSGTFSVRVAPDGSDGVLVSRPLDVNATPEDVRAAVNAVGVELGAEYPGGVREIVNVSAQTRGHFTLRFVHPITASSSVVGPIAQRRAGQSSQPARGGRNGRWRLSFSLSCCGGDAIRRRRPGRSAPLAGRASGARGLQYCATHA